MDYIMQLFQNRLLFTGLCAWASAQILKTIIHAIVHHTLDISRLVGDGGMPSGHSATVTSMAIKSGLLFGFDSYQFAILGIIAIIVMHDAMGVRLETSKQAKLLNMMTDLLNFGDALRQQKKLKEFVGHTPLQVVAGALLGFLIAVIM